MPRVGRIALVALAVVVAALAVALANNDEVAMLFNSWLEGKPKALVKIHVEIPQINASKCVVEVRRFPSRFNPTEDGYTELIHRGKAQPGSVVTVKNVIKMVQVAVVNETEPVYDSPEYAVSVLCIGDNETYTFMQIVHPIVKKPIVDVYVKAKFKTVEKGKSKSAGKSLLAAQLQPRQCDITNNKDYEYKDDWRWEIRGHCTAWTRLTYLNSIPGLKTAFGVVGQESAMYLEAWGAFCYLVDMDHCPSNMWLSQGKKLTESAVSMESPYISNGQRAVVLGNVYYVYEYYAWYDDDLMIFFVSEYFYPQEIRGLDVKVVGTYTPPSQPPSDATGPLRGDCAIWFNANRLTDNKLDLSTSISVNIGVFSVSVNISPYKAESPQYRSPYVSVKDVSGKSYSWYYWWYKNNDPLNYEVEFYGNP